MRTFSYRGMNVPSSKNRVHWTRTGRKYPDAKVVEFEKWIVPLLEKDREEFRRLLPLDGPANIRFKFIRKQRNRFDHVNPAQMIQDVMVKAGLLEDDDYRHLNPSFEYPDFDKDNPGVEITIL